MFFAWRGLYVARTYHLVSGEAGSVFILWGLKAFFLGSSANMLPPRMTRFPLMSAG